MATYIVAKGVKVKIRTEGGMTGADFVEALDKKTEQTILEALGRAKANGRKTVTALDL